MKDEEIVRFNNELAGAFKDIVESIEQSQTHQMTTMSTKQTDMFALTNKFRLPSGFENEAVGIWYDAKSAVAQ